jgi:CDP-paratose 2-epimerase
LTYLITGGCGFLGSNIAAQLIREGHTPIIFDNLSRYGSAQNLDWLQSLGKIRFVHGDIRSADDCHTLVKSHQVSTIFHLAGQVAMTTSIARPQYDFEINALGTLNLLEAIRLHSPESALIYSSTNKVYGDLEYLSTRETATRYELVDYPAGLPETIALDFHSPYGCSKGSADQYVLDYARIFGLRTAVFRHSSMYGGRQFSTIDQGWIGWFCGEAIRQTKGDRKPFTISGSGKQVRDVLHSSDMVTLYLRAAQQIDAICGQAFNVGGGMDNSLSLLELFEILEAKLGMELSWEPIASRESDQRVFVANLKKIGQFLDWRPTIHKETGITQMLEWVRSSSH